MRITSLMQQSVAIRRLSSTLLRKISSPINNIPSVGSRATMARAPTVTNATPIGMAPSISEQTPEHNHAKQFILERIWAVGMLPILPAAYFIHTPGMDFMLSIALVMHVHWGVHGVVHDYARPIVIGETWTKVSHMLVYAMTVLLFAGLMHFNYNDVGITKAFEMVWTL